jgi:hypothetical protein
VSSLLACFILHINSDLSRTGITCHHYCQANHKCAHRWRCHALPFALVVQCRRRSHCYPQWLDGSLFLFPNISKHLRWMKGCLSAQNLFVSRRNSCQSSSVEPFGGLSSSTLDGFLRSEVQFLQLSRFLSQFQSIDHEKNISSCIAQVAALWGTFENCSVGGATKDPCTLILIWDSDASFGLTPFHSDFIDYKECDIPVWDVTKVNKVIGIGTTIHKFTDIYGNPVVLPCVYYHLLKRTFASFPLKPTIRCIEVIQRFTVTAFR